MISRRDSLKLMGGSLILASGTYGVTEASARDTSDIRSKILIIGAGLAGITLASKLSRELKNASITIVDKDEKFYYQPGFTLVGVGIYKKDDVVFDKKDHMPKDVEWVKQNVKSINADANSVALDNGETLSYDYLVLATGIEYDYSDIKGITREDVLGDDSKICSIYEVDGAIKTNRLMEEFSKKGGTAMFADQKTPMKCSGANKKMLMMSESRIDRAGNRDKAKIELYGGAKTLFSAPIYAKAMETIFLRRDMEYNLSHQLVGIDLNKNIASYEHSMYYRQDGEDVVATEIVEKPFDWLHFTPRQKASKIYKEAGLAVSKGDVEGNWVDVNKETLQHTKYKNIFAIGDICGLPMGKTGASIRKMYPVLTENIISQIKGEPLVAKYNGYTACPLITEYGKAIMVEFNWTGRPDPLIKCFGDTRESYMNWLIKVYMFKPMIMKGMIRGLA